MRREPKGSHRKDSLLCDLHRRSCISGLRWEQTRSHESRRALVRSRRSRLRPFSRHRAARCHSHTHRDEERYERSTQAHRFGRRMREYHRARNCIPHSWRILGSTNCRRLSLAWWTVPKSIVADRARARILNRPVHPFQN